jgi:ketosteroid isomerase-like protein
MRRLLVALALLGAFAGCRRTIPDTDILDTADTRAVLAVIEQYRQAAERRDAAAVMDLVSKSYFDDGGTPDPTDDLDYGELAKAVAADYVRVPSTRLRLSVKQIEVRGERAVAFLFYEAHYRIATPRGEVPKQEQDVSRMAFAREGGAWRITSGL